MADPVKVVLNAEEIGMAVGEYAAKKVMGDGPGTFTCEYELTADETDPKGTLQIVVTLKKVG